MKKLNFAVYVSVPITEDLDSECLHGESRWERQVVSALLKSDKVGKVYLYNKAWQSNRPMPPKLIDGLPISEMQDTVCLFYYGLEMASKHKYKSLIINTHQFPGHEIPLFRSLKELYGRKWFFSYDAIAKSPKKIIDYTEIECEDNFEALSIPSVPDVSYSNNFNKKIILFPAKGILGALRYPQMDWGSEQAPGKDIFTWIANKLSEDESMQFHILSSYGQTDLDFLRCKDMKKELLSFPITQSLVPFANRIVMHPALPWNEVFSVLQNTKIIVSSNCTGGIPMEAASLGIPIISHCNAPMAACDGYLEAQLMSEEYFRLADRLYSDEHFYIEKANLYREFIKKNYTYEAFVDNLLEVLKARGVE